MDCGIFTACLGFNTFPTNTDPKLKFSQLTLVKFVILFGRGQVQTPLDKIPNALNSVNQLPLYVKKARIKPWLFISYLKNSLLLCTLQ